MAERARQSGPRLTILVKLLVAFTVPTAVLFAIFAVVAHEVMRRDLEAELGTRLAAVAASASTQLRGKYLVDLAPDDEAELLYEGARRKLEDVAAATGVARIYIFDREFRSRVDTAEGVAIGTTYFQAQLDRAELGRVFAGDTASGVLFQGQGGQLFKSGYAPVYASDKDRTIVLAVGVDAPAVFFDRLAALRHSLIAYGAGLVALLIIAAVLVATRLSRPVRSLVAAAERIGKGDLAAPVVATSRDEIGFLAETMDVMRRDLGVRDQRMQAMLSGIAHEVRNPLGGIELWTGILRDELDEDDARRSHADRIERELRYLEAVVNDFLDYARRPELELATVAVDDLVRDLVELMAGAAEAAGVTLGCTVEPCRASADPVQLRRALLNLLRNAVQACSAGNKVELSCRPTDAGAEVRVWNDGPPIPPEVRDHMFEPFFTTREKGTGLGLAFVGEILRDHGGTIAVESDAEAGTSFTLTLAAP
jgi:signal transduction histidine kinase